MATAEETIRTYLTALRDPESLKDDEAIEAKAAELDAEEDAITRLHLQEQLRALSAPSLESVEDEFVVHAKAWADEAGLSADAFAAEGVPAAVLRRAGFQVGGRSSKRSQRSSATSSGSSRRRSSGKRVTTEEVIDAMPTVAFTTKQLEEISGASPAVVRKAIKREQEAGRLTDEGPDPDHSGPGRAATMYRRA